MIRSASLIADTSGVVTISARSAPAAAAEEEEEEEEAEAAEAAENPGFRNKRPIFFVY